MIDTPQPIWAIGGPRRLTAAGVRHATAATTTVLASGAELAVGCATGADCAAILAACNANACERLHICSAFGPVPPLPGAASATPGTCRWSAPAAVACARAAGARIIPWAGGSASVPLAARLSRRTGAVARIATAGAVVLLSPNSRGSLLLARMVAARGLPVLVVPLDCRAASLPALDGAGAWSPAAENDLPPLCGALAWRPAQPSLLLMPAVGGEQ